MNWYDIKEGRTIMAELITDKNTTYEFKMAKLLQLKQNKVITLGDYIDAVDIMNIDL